MLWPRPPYYQLKAIGRSNNKLQGRNKATGCMEQEGSITPATPMMVTGGLLSGVLVGSPIYIPVPTLTLERQTPTPGIEENAKYAQDVIVEMAVIQLEVTKLAKEVVPEMPPI